ncbi:MAG: hypothetical protein D6731_01025 [Planctomycetota bacterium]|nr:MAG: hypothetical protein D6731_01025 [Planctomycetota bacterium]
MLARLEADDRVARAYISRDGTRLLLAGRPGATREDPLDACARVLGERGLRPVAESTAATGAAWREREGTDWLPRDAAWKLSWQEAEAFADRLLRRLEAEHGPAVRRLRPLLVASCFEAVRPADGSGPAPTHWPLGAPAAVRRRAIIAEARKHLDEASLRRLDALLSDAKRVRAILRAPPR